MAAGPMSPDRILVADSDPRTVTVVGQELRAAGFDVLEAFDGPTAFDACVIHAPSLALISYVIPGSTGVDLAQEITARTPVPVVLMSSVSGDGVAREATAAGILAFLPQPIDVRQLLPIVRIAIQRSRDYHALRSRTEQLNSALQGGRNVSLAAGLLMATFHIGREEAFERLRRHARSNRVRLEEVASELLRTAEEAAKLYEPLSLQVPANKPHTLCRGS